MNGKSTIVSGRQGMLRDRHQKVLKTSSHQGHKFWGGGGDGEGSECSFSLLLLALV